MQRERLAHGSFSSILFHTRKTYQAHMTRSAVTSAEARLSARNPATSLTWLTCGIRFLSQSGELCAFKYGNRSGTGREYQHKYSARLTTTRQPTMHQSLVQRPMPISSSNASSDATGQWTGIWPGRGPQRQTRLTGLALAMHAARQKRVESRTCTGNGHVHQN